MKKLSYFLAMSAIVASALFSGCKKKDDPTPTPDCADKTFPSNTGTATVDVVNYGTTGNFTTLSASAGDVLSFAVNITKGSSRPQKLRIYQTDCVNEVGTIVSLAGQTGAEDGDTRLDLQNTDDVQIRQFAYTVPSGMSTIYLNIEIDESGSKYTYERVKITVSGSGILDTWTATLGAQTNSAASRMSSGTGQTYYACDALANIGYIDITYAWNASGYLCSNPARFQPPVGLTAAAANCGEDGTALPTNGGTATYFKAYAGSDYATITDAGLTALTVSSSNPQYVAFTTTGGVYEFLNAKGKKGLIKVNAYTSGVSGTAGIEVKVQR